MPVGQVATERVQARLWGVVVFSRRPEMSVTETTEMGIEDWMVRWSLAGFGERVMVEAERATEGMRLVVVSGVEVVVSTGKQSAGSKSMFSAPLRRRTTAESRPSSASHLGNGWTIGNTNPQSQHAWADCVV